MATATGDIDRGESDPPHVSVALIDTVSGGVLHRQYHENAVGPVHAVVSENWAVYTLMALEPLRTQVGWGAMSGACGRRGRMHVRGGCVLADGTVASAHLLCRAGRA